MNPTSADKTLVVLAEHAKAGNPSSKDFCKYIDSLVGIVKTELDCIETLRSALQRNRQETIDLQMKLAQYELADDVEFTDEEVWLTAWADTVRSGRPLDKSVSEYADDLLAAFKKRFREQPND